MHQQRKRTFGGLILLLLFLSYYGSITLFWHSHHVGHSVIVHSHPFKNAKHSHTAAQYDLIKILTETAGLIGFVSILAAKAPELKKHTFATKPIPKALQFYSHARFLRGPPVLLHI